MRRNSNDEREKMNRRESSISPSPKNAETITKREKQGGSESSMDKEDSKVYIYVCNNDATALNCEIVVLEVRNFFKS